MALCTSLEWHDVEAILKKFAIHHIDSFKVLDGGSENTNYLIVTESGKFVLTISEQKTAEKTRQLAYLLAHLEKHHFETSKIVWNTHHEPISIWKGKPIMVKKFIKGNIQKDLPKALIHADIFSDNVIIGEDDSSVVIIDFEESAYYYRIFDIGMMIIGTCAEGSLINLDKVGYMLKGYQREIKLLDAETKALQAFTVYAGAAMTFWRHYNFNYVKPDPKLSNHYLGLKVLVDDIGDYSGNYFLEQVLGKLKGF